MEVPRRGKSTVGWGKVVGAVAAGAGMALPAGWVGAGVSGGGEGSGGSIRFGDLDKSHYDLNVCFLFQFSISFFFTVSEMDMHYDLAVQVFACYLRNYLSTVFTQIYFRFVYCIMEDGQGCIVFC